MSEFGPNSETEKAALGEEWEKTLKSAIDDMRTDQMGSELPILEPFMEKSKIPGQAGDKVPDFKTRQEIAARLLKDEFGITVDFAAYPYSDTEKHGISIDLPDGSKEELTVAPDESSPSSSAKSLRIETDAGKLVFSIFFKDPEGIDERGAVSIDLWGKKQEEQNSTKAS